ncbi:MAG: TetR/AcrR family transcriptional regulator [Haloarculaceae archaeon]
MSDDSTREQIMESTFHALAEHGYADLTIQAIADEFDKSKSLIHYHYDSKAELMVAFLEYLLDDFVEVVEEHGADDPAEQLRRIARIVVVGLDWDPTDVHISLLQLRAQAPFEEELRSQLVANDQLIRKLIVDIVREGVESGRFREVDPERYAATFRSAIEGAQSHEIILGEDAPTEEALAGIEEYLIDDLLVEGAGADGGDDASRTDGGEQDAGRPEGET